MPAASRDERNRRRNERRAKCRQPRDHEPDSDFDFDRAITSLRAMLDRLDEIPR